MGKILLDQVGDLCCALLTSFAFFFFEICTGDNTEESLKANFMNQTYTHASKNRYT